MVWYSIKKTEKIPWVVKQAAKRHRIPISEQEISKMDSETLAKFVARLAELDAELIVEQSKQVLRNRIILGFMFAVWVGLSVVYYLFATQVIAPFVWSFAPTPLPKFLVQFFLFICVFGPLLLLLIFFNWLLKDFK